jgi:hypothetical protein
VDTIAARLREVSERVRRAAAAAGRAGGDVRLIAVSKGQPSEAVREAYAAGQRDFGENYVQELCSKADALSELTDLRWHMIGHLQRNKVKLVAQRASSVQSVDSEALALELDKRREGEPLPVLIEVAIAGEAQKSGVAVDSLPALVQRVRACPKLALRGLMCVPPLSDDAQATRPHFAELRRLRDELGGQSALPELSMGMTADFEGAIAEGATLVRVGTAIFGPRAPRASQG